MIGSHTDRPSNEQRVVAVHLAARSNDVEKNLLHVDDLVREAARKHNPSLVVLPERLAGANSAGLTHGRTTARPIDGAPLQLIRTLSKELDVVVAAGFHAQRAGDTYITYVLAAPDGAVALHNKSFASPSDAAIARPGKWVPNLPKVDRLGGATVGLVAGWEWLRTDTVRDLRGTVDVALGGMCWPAVQFLKRRGSGGEDHVEQIELLKQVPRRMAQRLGAPAVMASLLDANRVHSIPATPNYRGLIAVTQIIDAQGKALGHLGPDDPEGYVAADLALGRVRPSGAVPEGAWLEPVDDRLKASAALARTAGSWSYRLKQLSKSQPWREWPAADLPSRLPPTPVGHQLVATSGPSHLRPPA